MLALLLGACASPDALLDTALPRQGETVSGSLDLTRTRLPLPEGQWIVIGRRTFYNDIYRINAELLLIRTAANEFGQTEISDMLSLSTNLQRGVGGFQNLCTPEITGRYLHAVIDSDRVLRQDCWVIEHMEMSFTEEQIRENRDLAEARDYVRDNRILVPINMVYAKHRLSDAENYLTVWRFSNPDLAGITQTHYGDYQRSDWHKANIGRFPDKLAYVEQLKRSASSWQEELRLAFF